LKKKKKKPWGTEIPRGRGGPNQSTSRQKLAGEIYVTQKKDDEGGGVVFRDTSYHDARKRSSFVGKEEKERIREGEVSATRQGKGGSLRRLKRSGPRKEASVKKKGLP